jgi:hypothetical protein
LEHELDHAQELGLDCVGNGGRVAEEEETPIDGKTEDTHED